MERKYDGREGRTGREVVENWWMMVLDISQCRASTRRKCEVFRKGWVILGAESEGAAQS